MTDYAALAQEAVQFMADNQSAVDAHPGAAYQEQRILCATVGTESAGGSTSLLYSYQAVMRRGAQSTTNRGDAYTFTHAIMFGTDMGNITVSGIDQSGYEAEIEAALITYATDYDVLGEMLVCAKCLGYWSANCDAALDSFLVAWTSLDRENFGESYHPLLVGGLLFKMLAE